MRIVGGSNMINRIIQDDHNLAHVMNRKMANNTFQS